MNNNSSLKTGTIGGTLISILASITWMDIEKTIVMAAIGATVSFLMSLLLKKMIQYARVITGRRGPPGRCQLP